MSLSATVAVVGDGCDSSVRCEYIRSLSVFSSSSDNAVRTVTSAVNSIRRAVS